MQFRSRREQLEKLDELIRMPDDDAMGVLAHLHRVQEVAESGPIVNVIEVMGCCEEVATTLVGELNELLPDARAVTISQIVQTQVTVNRLMNRLSYVIFAILMMIGGASIASVMSSAWPEASMA